MYLIFHQVEKYGSGNSFDMDARKKLQNYFGEKQFSLLYKASVHGFSTNSLLQICSRQGPTLTVIYSKDRIVVAAYMHKNYGEGNYLITVLSFKRLQLQNAK